MIKKLFTIGLVIALSGCAVQHPSKNVDKIPQLLNERDHAALWQQWKERQPEYIKRQREYQDLIRQRQLSREEDIKNLRKNGFVVCEQHEHYSACK